jgi:hypothetical protein
VHADEKLNCVCGTGIWTPDQQRATQTKRLEIREIMGKNMREITLK